jgi:hypothetical protein
MKKLNKTNVFRNMILLIAAIVITISLTRIAYEVYEDLRIYDSREVDATFQVSNKVGLAADTQSLNFGIVPPGGSSQREILLYHNYTTPLKIKFIYSGSIARVLWPITPFYLEPGVERHVSIVAYAPATHGNYSGIVKVLYIKP